MWDNISDPESWLFKQDNKQIINYSEEFISFTNNKIKKHFKFLCEDLLHFVVEEFQLFICHTILKWKEEFMRRQHLVETLS